jgi:GMP synthase PP-ATPase subunit
MTANAVRMDSQILGEMIDALKTVEGIATVFYDVTNKPPATIEWE